MSQRKTNSDAQTLFLQTPKIKKQNSNNIPELILYFFLQISYFAAVHVPMKDHKTENR